MKERERKSMRMEDTAPQTAKRWLEDLSKGLGVEIDARTLEGLQVVHVQKGLIRCNFVIPNGVSDKDGNWHTGAIAILMDTVGAAAIFSSAGRITVSVDFSVSHFSTAKIQEEVEIEAKVVGQKGKLSSVGVEIRRKGNGELIALGKQWMVSTKIVSSGDSKL